MLSINILELQQEIMSYARSIGIDKIGFTTAAPFRELKNRLKRQQELGYQSGFEEKDMAKRTEPALLLDQAESIISIAIAYPSQMEIRLEEKKVSGVVSFVVLLGGQTTISSFEKG